MPISCVSLQSPSIRLRKYVVKSRAATATHLEILALRAAHWDEFLDIAAALRGDAGRENVTSCGATSGRLQHRWQFWSWTARILKSLAKAAWCLWRVSTVFTRSAVTPPEVKRFGWKLGHTDKGHIAITCRITLNHLSTAAMRLMSNYFHHLLSLDAYIDSRTDRW